MTVLVRSMRLAGHALRRGLQGMRETPLIQLLAISTTAVCMLLLGGIVLAWVNAREVVVAWGIEVPLAVYVHDGVEPKDVTTLQERIESLPEVVRTEVIDPESALARLISGFGEDSELLRGVEADMLPMTLEVFLAPDTPPEFGPALAERLEAFPLVEDVVLAGIWAQQADTMLETLARIAGGTALLVACACVAITWSTIRLTVYARRSEIHILRLVGGTAAFVRGPFLVEGAVQGMLGAAVALGLLSGGFEALRPFLTEGLVFMFAAGALRFFTSMELALGIALGGLVGILGARAATGRYVEQ